MRIALATCANLPDWEVDDRPFHQALRSRSVTIAQPVWDDPSVDWSAFDACLIRTTWDYQDKRDAFLAWASRAGEQTRLFNPLPVVRWNTHKSYLRDLSERGVRTVPTVWVEAGTTVDVAAVVGKRGWPGGFLKPAIGATSRETLRFDGTGGALARAQAHLERLAPQETMLLQPYLASVETGGELSAVFIDDHLSHTVRKIPPPGDYRVQDDFGGTDEPVELTATEQAEAARAVEAAAAASGHRGPLLYARADFLRDDQGQLCLTELEAVEPSLFFRHSLIGADRLAAALVRRLVAPPSLSRPDVE